MCRSRSISSSSLRTTTEVSLTVGKTSFRACAASAVFSSLSNDQCFAATFPISPSYQTPSSLSKLANPSTPTWLTGCAADCGLLERSVLAQGPEQAQSFRLPLRHTSYRMKSYHRTWLGALQLLSSLLHVQRRSTCSTNRFLPFVTRANAADTPVHLEPF